jgi:hypothetical protein
MRTLWNNLYDIWEIFIEDPQDPALLEFGFPDAVHGWLRRPESYVGQFSAVEQISPQYFDRIRTFLERGQILAACWVPEGETPEEIVRPSEHHFVLIGKDGTDIHADGQDTIGVPLLPAAPVPSWDPFPDVSAGFRMTCEQLAGVFPNGVDAWSLPFVLRPDQWVDWRDGFPTDAQGGPDVPQLLAESKRETWILQRNYYGVCTLLQAPGRIVRGDYGGRAQVLEHTSPEEWLAGELEGGTRQQPATAE